MKEYLVRLIYCEMLGHSTPFGYIHAVKFAQQASLFEKRVGYLAVTLMLHENHELILLLINTIQKDLRSSNIVEICMALTAVMRLINSGFHFWLQISYNRNDSGCSESRGGNTHPRPGDRSQESCFSSSSILFEESIKHHTFVWFEFRSISHLLSDSIRRSLCDQDPGVMAASLNIFYDMSVANPSSFKDLTSSFVNILKQVIEGRLPRDFEYHKVPAPWIQLKILRILAVLGADDQAYANHVPRAHGQDQRAHVRSHSGLPTTGRLPEQRCIRSATLSIVFFR
jgi:AP-4 complex subunit epsilon-1